MMVTTVIQREEAALGRKTKNNLLVYGRRKVGKTFLVKEFLEYDIYVLIKRGGGYHIEGGPLRTLDSYHQFQELLSAWLAEGKCVAIDEFQRLPKDFLDILQTLPTKGRLILTGSSFRLVKEVISPKSPVLGLFSELKISLLQPLDIFNGLNRMMEPTLAFELSTYLRDPWLVQYLDDGKISLEDVLFFSREAIQSLTGEVFLEEERRLSMVYEGIIRSLARGHWKLAEVANLLYSRKVLDKPDPHLVRPYLLNMEDMDLITRTKIYGKKEFMYRIRSPIMELGFLLDERYDFFSQNMPSKVLRKELSNIIPRQVERFTGEFFAQVYGGRYEYFYSPQMDIDFIITRGKNTLACGEVKWGKMPNIADIDLFLERTRHIKGDKIIFSKKIIKDDRVISLTPDNLVEWMASFEELG